MAMESSVQPAVDRLKRVMVRGRDDGFYMPHGALTLENIADLAAVFGAYLNEFGTEAIPAAGGETYDDDPVARYLREPNVPRGWLQPWMRNGRHLIVDGVPTRLPESAQILITIPREAS